MAALAYQTHSISMRRWLGQVRQPRAEAETKESAQDEDVVGSAAGVRVMRVDPQSRAVVQQAIEDIGRFVMGRRHHLDAVGAVLIGEMGIEAEPGSCP